MAVRQTSLQAYETVKYDPGIALRQQIFELVRNLGVVSRRQIAKALDLETSCVAGRVNELISAGKLREEEDPSPCPITGRNVRKVFDPESI